MTESSDLEFHKRQLQRHCRGILDHKFAYTCKEEKNKVLLKRLGIDIDDDDVNVQPTLFCHSCRTKAAQFSETLKSSLALLEWKPHRESPCEISLFCKQQRKGGRPKKERKNCGRPRSDSVEMMLLRTTLPSYKVSSSLSVSRFLPSATVPLRDLQCSLCANVVHQPVETPCRKLVCSTCVVSLLRSCSLAKRHMR